MNHQTPFLIALGMLTASALVVGVSGWILFARDHAARKLKLATASAGSSGSGSEPTVSLTDAPTAEASSPHETSVTASVTPASSDEHHHEVTEES